MHFWFISECGGLTQLETATSLRFSAPCHHTAPFDPKKESVCLETTSSLGLYELKCAISTEKDAQKGINARAAVPQAH